MPVAIMLSAVRLGQPVTFDSVARKVPSLSFRRESVRIGAARLSNKPALHDAHLNPDKPKTAAEG